MKNGLRQCSLDCIKTEKPCKYKECRHHIEFEDEYNCTLVSIYENGPMTLRQIAERLGISFARVKQIETAALEKLKKRCLRNSITF